MASNKPTKEKLIILFFTGLALIPTATFGSKFQRLKMSPFSISQGDREDSKATKVAVAVLLDLAAWTCMNKCLKQKILRQFVRNRWYVKYVMFYCRHFYATGRIWPMTVWIRVKLRKG